jgi:hypothetical protein
MLIPVALLSTFLLLLIWARLNPACPCCSSRKWDRRRCRPLLFCRNCAQRIDRKGVRYN